MRQRGFTLLEMLAAFVLFAMVFAVSLQILSGSLRNVKRAGNFTEAALLAQTVISRLGTEIPVEPGREDGQFDDVYRWEVAIEEYALGQAGNDDGLSDLGDVPIDLYRVDLRIIWEEGGRERAADFTTLESAVPDPRNR